ncbi:MAG TPA: hypothetical protein VJN88_16820 [Ktedonobacterales bacterium]|nr:hypothetical protein [Ktedonobacterales bacterium]
MVIALAGRRIDANDATPARFPLANRDLVRDRLRKTFIEVGARALVCSGACGADLLALEVAGGLAMERSLILPFGARHFRRVSVADRPGDWGPIFDRVYRETQDANQVVTLRGHGHGHAAYDAATRRILEVALAIARDGSVAGEGAAVTAIAVWDGSARGPDDLTASFIENAKHGGMRIREIATL